MYAAGRPDYPAEVYERLTGRCGLRTGALVMESGPGTGLVTRHIVGCGGRVVAVEPDRAMAAYLASRFPWHVEIVIDTFEHAELGADRFDLAVAATSFHWVDQAAGIAKLGRIVRPGGWVALWWTIFDDPGREDPFRDALESRLGEKDPGGLIARDTATGRPVSLMFGHPVLGITIPPGRLLILADAIVSGERRNPDAWQVAATVPCGLAPPQGGP